jgi:hypothetical protein
LCKLWRTKMVMHIALFQKSTEFMGHKRTAIVGEKNTWKSSLEKDLLHSRQKGSSRGRTAFVHKWAARKDVHTGQVTFGTLHKVVRCHMIPRERGRWLEKVRWTWRGSRLSCTGNASTHKMMHVFRPTWPVNDTASF